jgi:hypothetical protein
MPAALTNGNKARAAIAAAFGNPDRNENHSMSLPFCFILGET